MKVRLQGTEAECDRLATLLTLVPEVLVVEESPRYSNRGNSRQVRVYLELQFPNGPGPVPTGKVAR